MFFKLTSLFTFLGLLGFTCLPMSDAKCSDMFEKVPDERLLSVPQYCDHITIGRLKLVCHRFKSVFQDKTLYLPEGLDLNELDNFIHKHGIQETLFRASNTKFGFKILAELPHFPIEIIQKHCTPAQLKQHLDQEYIGDAANVPIPETEYTDFVKWLPTAVPNLRLLTIVDPDKYKTLLGRINAVAKKHALETYNLHIQYLNLLSNVPKKASNDQYLNFIKLVDEQWSTVHSYHKLACAFSPSDHVVAIGSEQKVLLFSLWKKYGQYPKNIKIRVFTNPIFLDTQCSKTDKITVVQALATLGQKGFCKDKIDDLLLLPLSIVEKILLVDPLKSVEHPDYLEVLDEVFASSECTIGDRLDFTSSLVEISDTKRILESIQFILNIKEEGLSFFHCPKLIKYLKDQTPTEFVGFAEQILSNPDKYSRDYDFEKCLKIVGLNRALHYVNVWFPQNDSAKMTEALKSNRFSTIKRAVNLIKNKNHMHAGKILRDFVKHNPDVIVGGDCVSEAIPIASLYLKLGKEYQNDADKLLEIPALESNPITIVPEGFDYDSAHTAFVLATAQYKPDLAKKIFAALQQSKEFDNKLAGFVGSFLLKDQPKIDINQLKIISRKLTEDQKAYHPQIMFIPDHYLALAYLYHKSGCSEDSEKWYKEFMKICQSGEFEVEEFLDYLGFLSPDNSHNIPSQQKAMKILGKNLKRFAKVITFVKSFWVCA